ncbi:hypothetical protein dqs_0137 [Azoarcus olearius]|uniref:DUF1622 domain-containing protein n=1 Tax=Azoarcus sp. (strain BH72) TaxID=418699 RepID=UPI0008062769|nr:DUF1622 domain-containing protein [Azoarcus olearius]ANQ83220.1 hypothetical protein dqs_0137 [Azoarcus olearius]
MFSEAEEWVRMGVEWLRLLVETIGAAIIAVGIVVALHGLARHWLHHCHDEFNPVRLAFARYLAMALEFQLAADILSTAVAPSWEQLGKLATVAVIRTGLNFFLMREIRDEHRGTAEDAGAEHPRPGRPPPGTEKSASA